MRTSCWNSHFYLWATVVGRRPPWADVQCGGDASWKHGLGLQVENSLEKLSCGFCGYYIEINWEWLPIWNPPTVFGVSNILSSCLGWFFQIPIWFLEVQWFQGSWASQTCDTPKPSEKLRFHKNLTWRRLYDAKNRSSPFERVWFAWPMLRSWRVGFDHVEDGVVFYPALDLQEHQVAWNHHLLGSWAKLPRSSWGTSGHQDSQDPGQKHEHFSSHLQTLACYWPYDIHTYCIILLHLCTNQATIFWQGSNRPGSMAMWCRSSTTTLIF